MCAGGKPGEFSAKKKRVTILRATPQRAAVVAAAAAAAAHSPGAGDGARRRRRWLWLWPLFRSVQFGFGVRFYLDGRSLYTTATTFTTNTHAHTHKHTHTHTRGNFQRAIKTKYERTAVQRSAAQSALKIAQ